MWCHDTIYDFEKIPDMHLNNKYIQLTVMAVSTFTETVSGHVIINFVSFCSLFQHVLKILQRRYVEYTFKRNLSFMWSMVFHNFLFLIWSPGLVWFRCNNCSKWWEIICTIGVWNIPWCIFDNKSMVFRPFIIASTFCSAWWLLKLTHVLIINDILEL